LIRNHNHDVNINVPKQDLEELIDKITDSAITIIAAFTIGSIVKSLICSRSP
jgi:hypothetical protein